MSCISKVLAMMLLFFLWYEGQTDPCCYNLLISNEVAVILPGDGTHPSKQCDLILHLCAPVDGRLLDCISASHPEYFLLGLSTAFS